MALIKTSEVQVGMVTAKEVKANNRVLLPKGAEISERHMKLFKTWGVVEIEIEGEHKQAAFDASQFLSPEQVKKVKKYVAGKFHYTDKENELMLELKKLSFKMLVEQKSQEPPSEDEEG